MRFEDLHLSPPLLAAVAEAGYTEPTPVQAAAIPRILMGQDLVAVAQTGTGKTASFVLPLIDIMAEGRARARMPRCLILEPTRELATQVSENFEKYGRNHRLAMALIIGGVGFAEQDRLLEKGVDVLIATPGRLIDQHERGRVMLSGVEFLVIDEADRMLDMGFIPDVERICALLRPERQTLLFSATMPAPVKKLADRFMSSPKTVEVSRPATANADIDQRLLPVDASTKREQLKTVLRDPAVTTVIVFCNRKTTVRELTTHLKRARLSAGQIHGDMEQPERLRELERFKQQEIRILVASDVAARGLDIKGVSHVVNYDVPWHPDDYVHRIGRTGRAGQLGVAITLAAPEDAEAIQRIEQLTGQRIPRGGAEGAASRAAPAAPAAQVRPAPERERPAPDEERRADGERQQAREAVGRHGPDKRPARSGGRRKREDEPRTPPPAGEPQPRARAARERSGRADHGTDHGTDHGAEAVAPGFGAAGLPEFLKVSARG